VVAVPVAAPSTCAELGREVDAIVCFATPEPFLAVGRFYDDFDQTSDEEVRQILAAARARDEARHGPSSADRVCEVQPEADGVRLVGDLVLPADARAVILFAHGSGSSRHSPRNRAVAAALGRRGLGTLLIDLLTEREEAEEAATGHLRFDIALLARRLGAITDWLRAEEATRGLPVGYFGASTGGGAALAAAAERADVFAVVSRGGRPDLAGPALARVKAPTLLIVGGGDGAVLRMNRDAEAHMTGERRLEIVPGATHLFEEPGAIETVACLAGRWFEDHVPAARTSLSRS
jgi:dienelactone hydrolase